MTEPSDNGSQVPKPTRSKPTRLEEARQIIQEYADELRELMKKMRQRLH